MWTLANGGSLIHKPSLLAKGAICHNLALFVGLIISCHSPIHRCSDCGVVCCPMLDISRD